MTITGAVKQPPGERLAAPDPEREFRRGEAPLRSQSSPARLSRRCLEVRLDESRICLRIARLQALELRS